ncbi:MAG TPA: CoA pyrophosphatase [Propionibacteriaceae bacterium]|nr:CoA pyrophosphatase [Propionibacteriaceae bacterium]
MTIEIRDLPSWLQPLAASLQDSDRRDQVVALRPGVGGRSAAVLALLGQGESGPEMLFIERGRTLRTHAGQVALPGGAMDPEDADLAATALREAYEETAVDRSGIEVLGCLPAVHVAVSGFDVTTVVGWWRTPSAVRVADPREVASVLVVPVAELTDPAHRVSVRHPSGYTGPAFQVAGVLIWGLTAYLVDGLLDLAGWQRPWDAERHIDIPARYLHDRHPAGRPGSPTRDTGGPDAH